MKNVKLRVLAGLFAALGCAGLTSCGDDAAGGNKKGCEVNGCDDGFVCEAGTCQPVKDLCGGKTCNSDETCVDGECKKAGDDPNVCGDRTCNADETCVDGECKKAGDDPNVCGNKTCNSDETCVDGECKKAGDEPNVCGDRTCNADEVCIEGECKAKCGDDVCLSEETCVEGACVVVCGDDICEAGDSCVEGECRKAGDEPIVCGDKTCNLDEACVEGECRAVCGGTTCSADASCVNGMCVDNACLEEDGTVKTCQEGWECVKGLCEETACLVMEEACPEGQSCKGGACMDNECLEMICEAGEVCSKGECVYEACVEVEECTRGRVCVKDGTCQFVPPPAIEVELPESLETDERGNAVDMYVTLNHEPESEVTLECVITSESSHEEAVVDCSGIVFTSENWQDAQTITVTGVADNVIDDDQAYKLSIKTVSEEEAFNGLSVADIDLINLNTDKAELLIDAGNSLMTDEKGMTAKFEVVLSSKPEAAVVIRVVSEDLTEGKVVTEQVTIEPDDWKTPHYVTIQGVDDKDIDGTVSYDLTLSVSSDDENYNKLEPYHVTAFNIDDDTAGISTLATEIKTDEDKETTTVPVRLNTHPTSDVTVTVTVSDATEAIVDKTSLTFTPDNYSDPQNIVVSGVADHTIDGDQKYTVTLSITSEDENYNKLEDIVLKGVNGDTDAAGIVVSQASSAIVSESGTTVDMEVTLNSIPSSDVKVKVEAKDTTEVSVSPVTLTFTSENWNVPQKVTVKGVDDNEIDGDVKSQIVLTGDSGDGHYAGVSRSVEFTTLDDDKAGLVVVSTPVSMSENGGTGSFTVQLSAKPASEVTISFSSSDPTELLSEISSLTIKPEDWNKPQTVKIQAKDDSQADGTQKAHIILKSSSSDEHFVELTGVTVDYMITDDEKVSVTLSLKATELKPGAQTTELSVSLSTEPVDEVTVNVVTTNGVTAKLGKTSFTFKPENWKTAQVTTVTNSDPMSAAKVITTETLSATATSKGLYNGVKSNDAKVKIYAFVSQDFKYKGDVEGVVLLPGSYKLEVWGAQGRCGGWTCVTNGVNYAGKGGYSYGTVSLSAKSNLYVCVGGNTYHEATDMGGYNGGGFGHGRKSNLSNGGGATHIAKTMNRGVLKNYSSNQDEVLIVAGGGGGVEWDGLGGVGGGEKGGDGVQTSHGGNLGAIGTGGTQTAGGVSNKYNDPYVLVNGSFGAGGYGYNTSSSSIQTYGEPGDFGAGGGGGWYGGGGNSYAGIGGGGSGHLGAGVTGSMMAGNSLFTAPGGGTETGHVGEGYARITVVE